MAVEDSGTFAPEEIPAYFPDNNDTWRIFSFSDYVTALQAKRQCMETDAFPGRSPAGAKRAFSITGIYGQGFSWYELYLKSLYTVSHFYLCLC